MDPSTYSVLLQELGKKPFADDKNAVLRQYLQYYFSAQQCAGVVEKYTHASDKVEALTIIAPRLVTINGPEATIIVKAFSFGSDQVKALQQIASHIHDPANKYAVLDAFTFASDKDKARKILDTAVMTGAPPAPAAHCHHAYAGVPYQPPPQQTGYPAPGGYPQGTYPPPPQGTYPPPHQGTYPPPPHAGTYPPPPAGQSGYGQPYPTDLPPAGFNFQMGIGGTAQPPPPQQQQGAPGDVNVQFGLGAMGFPTGNISFKTNQPWP